MGSNRKIKFMSPMVITPSLLLVSTYAHKIIKLGHNLLRNRIPKVEVNIITLFNHILKQGIQEGIPHCKSIKRYPYM